MTGLTVLTALVVLAALAGRISYGHALAVGGATPAGVALVMGSIVVPTFYATAVGAASILGLTVLFRGRWGTRVRQPLPPGGILLTIFFLWSVFVTLAAPLLFDGQPLIHPVATQLVAGVVTSSNIAQMTYLFLGVCVVVFLARSNAAPPALLGWALGLCLVLSFARYLAIETGLPFPDGFFDNSPNPIYIQTAAGGLPRVRGILSEPAALATICITAIAYFLPRSADVAGWRRGGCCALVVVAAYLGVVSTSTTFVVAGLVNVSLFGILFLVRFAARRSTFSLTSGLVACVAIVAVVVVMPVVISFIDSSIQSKLGSESYGDRSSADVLTLGVFFDTYGFGVGLGSSRASSFAPTLLSSVGLVGALLFVSVIATLVLAARDVRSCRPVVFALVAFLVVKITTAPDISDPTGILWISLGVLSHAALRSRSAPPSLARNRRPEPWNPSRRLTRQPESS